MGSSDILESRWVRVNDMVLHTRFSVAPVPTEAPPIVLVHGLSVSSAYMVPTAEHLAPYHPVYAPDLPGYGKSTKPSRVLSVPELSEVLVAWMCAVELERAVFLGNSLGCQIIVNLALHSPERMLRAVLVGPTMDQKARHISQQAYRLLVDMTREPISLFPLIAAEYLAAGPRRTICTLESGLRDPLEKHLPHMPVPTLVVRGERDPIVSQAWVQRVNRLLPQGRLIIIAGAAHAVNFNSPERLTDCVRTFLKEEY